MKLGIFVNTNRHLAAVTGITSAAIAQGHTVSIFVMDEGTRLLSEPSFTALSGQAGVTLAFCDHSAQHLGTKPASLPGTVACGSQFENATMNHEADRVIVL
ncbi:MAG TPA: DsrE family protein [Candidatus Methanoperedens sp.]|nr:DsrE family protein [Candidatus Methanoperedens sp.]